MLEKGVESTEFKVGVWVLICIHSVASCPRQDIDRIQACLLMMLGSSTTSEVLRLRARFSIARPPFGPAKRDY